MNRKMTTAGATLAIAAAALTVNSAPAHAQQTELQALRAQIEELQGRLDKLEADQVKTSDATKAAPPVSAKSPVTVSGLLQVQSLDFFGQDNSRLRASDTFRLRRGELRITAPKITDRISGTIQLDTAKTISGSTNIAGGGNLNIRARENLLQEIQITYQLSKNLAGTSSNYIDVGQYKIPIGYESLVSSSALPFIERALLFSQRDPFDAGYGDVRDTGIQLRGTQGQFDYRLGVFNGMGDRQNTLATSDPKAVLARLAFKPRGIQGLEIGVSGGKGNTGVSIDQRAKRDLFNLFTAYKRDKFSFQAEYLKGNSQRLAGTGQRDVKGYYAGVGYLFTPKIEGLFRYDYFDANRQAAAGVDSDARDLVLGLNYYIKGNNAKIQTNLIRRSGGNDPALGSSNPNNDLRSDRTELRTSFQVAF